jgi:hypothetical protein
MCLIGLFIPFIRDFKMVLAQYFHFLSLSSHFC